MRITHRALGALLPALLVCTTAAPGTSPSAEPKVTLKPVKYAELGATVRGLKGKVVVVEFWGEW